ncbi:MAG: prepilin-type N-terminal cleavage/methylation domain-containing protein [bacterium]
MFRKGFTLAEMLMTLAILGIVATVTMVILLPNIQEAHLRTQWKGTYSEFAQVSREFATDNGGDLAGTFTSYDDLMSKILAYMNYTKKCNVGTPVGSNGCWSGTTYKLSGQIYGINMSIWTRAVLNNGVLITLYVDNYSCTSNSGGRGNTCASVSFDVNGFRGPNKWGKDIFAVWLLRDGNIRPGGSQGDILYNYPAGYSCDVATYPNTQGSSCAAEYLKR